MAIANNSNSFMPKQLFKQFEDELSYLPFLLAGNTDLIAVSAYEDLDFTEQLFRLGFPTPGQILKSDLFNPNQKILSDVKSIKPWGWAPNLKHKISQSKKLNIEDKPGLWSEEERHIYSRKTALHCLEQLLSKTNHNELYISSEIKPQVLLNIEAVQAFLVKHKAIVLKEPWSASGKGLIFIRKPQLPLGIIQRCNSIIKQQSYIMGETILDKHIDLSMQFYADGSSIEYTGTSYFETNEHGQYLSHLLNQLPQTDPNITDFIKQNHDTLKTDLLQTLKNSSIPKLYKGDFGVDIMLVKNNNRLVFHPCLEINLRHNMGTLSLAIQNIIHPEAKGKFRVVFEPQTRFEMLHFDPFEALVIKNQKVLKGKFPIVHPKGKQFGAYISLE